MLILVNLVILNLVKLVMLNLISKIISMKMTRLMLIFNAHYCVIDLDEAFNGNLDSMGYIDRDDMLNVNI